MIYLKMPEDDTTEFFERLKGMINFLFNRIGIGGCSSDFWTVWSALDSGGRLDHIFQLSKWFYGQTDQQSGD